jgi:phage terminase large subunit-like protein
MPKSISDRLAALERLELLEDDPPPVVAWETIARPEQLPPPDDWFCWYIQAGRGWGKTRTGAEYTWSMSWHAPRIAIVAESFGDGRDFCIEGETGIKTLHPDLEWNRSIGEMTFPSGAKGKIFSAEDPQSLRGPNIYLAWCDEIAKWRYLKETWDMLIFCMRKGDPRVVVTTTPKPYPLLKQIKAQPTTVLVKGRTYDNLDNLASVYINTVIKPYEGTELGRQELNAEDLEDVEGALWQRVLIERLRVVKAPDLERIVVAIDPSATATGDEAGIITAGIGWCACKGQPERHGFVFSDDSVQASPKAWAASGVTAYHKFDADMLVAEDNNGGEMVEVTISTIKHAPPVKRIHASRGKRTRAEPIAMLYEQGKVHHVGAFPKLEDELCSWVPGDDSPNRLDALVWAITELLIGSVEVTVHKAKPVPNRWAEVSGPPARGSRWKDM